MASCSLLLLGSLLFASAFKAAAAQADAPRPTATSRSPFNDLVDNLAAATTTTLPILFPPAAPPFPELNTQSALERYIQANPTAVVEFIGAAFHWMFAAVLIGAYELKATILVAGNMAAADPNAPNWWFGGGSGSGGGRQSGPAPSPQPPPPLPLRSSPAVQPAQRQPILSPPAPDPPASDFTPTSPPAGAALPSPPPSPRRRLRQNPKS